MQGIKCVVVLRNITQDMQQFLNTLTLLRKEVDTLLNIEGLSNCPNVIATTDPKFSDWNNPNSFTYF